MLKTRDKTLDSLKGITMIIVVLRHVIQGGASDSDTVLIGNMMMAVEMPLFMILSGYFGGKNYRNEIFDVRQLKNKLKKITISYMVPFLSFFFIFKVMILRQYTGNIFNLISKLANDITISLWFLFVIWILGIISTVSFYITGFTIKGTNKKYLKFMVYIGSYVTMLSPWVIFALKNKLNFLGTKLVLYYSIFYLMGYIIKCYRNEIEKLLVFLRIKDVLYAVTLLLFVVITCNVSLLNIQDNLKGIIVRFTAAICGSYVLTYLCYYYKEKINKTYLPYLGKYTLEVYYVHSLFIRIMNIDNTVPLFTIRGFLNSSILLLLLSIFTFVVIIIIKSNELLEFVIFGKSKSVKKTKNICSKYNDSNFTRNSF